MSMEENAGNNRNSATNPSEKTTNNAATSPQTDHETVSRRDFIRVTAATGIASAGLASLTEPASALAQGTQTSVPENSLPKGDSFYMYEGTAAQATLEQLRAAGLHMLFHTNTSGFVPFWQAIYKAGDVQVIQLTHEGQAVAAAAGYAMASKKFGFFFGSEAGIGNAVSNIYCAWKDRVPMLVTFSGGDLSNQGKDSAESWDDQLGPTRPFTNWTANLLTEEMPDIIRRALKYAYGPPSGPVTLVWGESRENQQVKAPIYKMDLSKARHSFRGKPEMIQKAAQWLAEAQNPMFLVGPEIYQDGAEKEIKELAEKLSVPVAELGWPNELHANFPTDHVLFAGKLNAQRIPRNVDLLINFGEKFATGRGSPFRGTPVVHVSNDPDILGKVFPADLAIASDMRVAIRDISDAVDALLTRDRQARVRSKRLEEVSTLTNALKQSRQMALRGRFDMSPLSWERVGYELEQALEKDAVIVPEVGTQSVKLLGQLKFGIDNKLRIGRTTGSALGWGVAAALGVNLALPERQVVSIQGDGGILFGQTETLWSIARYEAPMLIVVMNNGVYNDSRVRNMSGGGILFEAGYDFNGYLGNPDVDFTKIAEAYSLKGEKVRNASDLAPALKRALSSMRDGKAVVLDVKVAPDGQPLSQPAWYPRHSITEIRNKKRAD